MGHLTFLKNDTDNAVSKLCVHKYTTQINNLSDVNTNFV